MPTTLILDFGGVISLPQDQAFIASTCAALGASGEAFTAAYHRHRPGLDEGRLTGRDYFSLVIDELGGHPSDFDLDSLVAADLNSWFRFNQAVVDAFPRLRERFGKLAILSNMHPEGWERFQTDFDSWQWFDEVFISALLSMSKPDPAIYRYAMDRLSARGDEILFVDDSQQNLDAAGELGWETHLFQGVDAMLETILG